MRTVGPSKAYIDYSYEKPDGERLGVRVRLGHALLFRSDGNGPNDRSRTIADDSARVPIPIDAEAINVMGVVQEYMARHPNSDLADLLSGRKKFLDAIEDTPDSSTHL